ncbi:MAG: hypothetical protein GY758_22145 [Fuerstiella sp.]|nr:hypothetical protein [Fuerstiella sp.]
MTEPREDNDNGPDFSFLGNDSVGDDAGELDFSDATVTPSQPTGHTSKTNSSQPTDGTDSPAPEGDVAKTDSADFRTTSEKAIPPASDGESSTAGAASAPERRVPMVPQKTFTIVAGYAAALTLLFLLLLLTGRVSLTGVHPLESLPDIAPLQKNEFLPVEPADASLPRDHTLKLSDSRRFGDVIITPLKVTTEPISFIHMTSGKTASDRKTAPVMKLWFELKNASTDAAFPPWDVGLMCSRMPAEGTDDSTKANSWLMVRHTADAGQTRLLNYFHPPASEYDLVGQHSRQLVQPGQSITTFIASSPEFSRISADDVNEYRWRLQLRKGVNRLTKNGVTTLLEIAFTQAEVSTSG